jgi:error-prone DNA polymerase
MPSPTPLYAELQVTTNFSFLRGASHAEELAMAAASLGHAAIAVTDRNTLAGVVRAHLAARGQGLRLVVGCRLDLDDGGSLLAWPTDRAAYGGLSRLLTLGRLRAPKGECSLGWRDVEEHADGILFAAVPPDHPGPDFAGMLTGWRRALGRRLYLAATRRYRGDDAARLARLADLGGSLRVPLVATNDVHYHAPERRRLQDVLTCIRERCTIHEAGWRLAANAERYLKAPDEMARLFARHPDALARTQEIVSACAFRLDELRYEYPEEVAAGGRGAREELEHLVREGAAGRYPGGVPAEVQAQIRHELDLIAQLGYEPYFLTVHDIVKFAQANGILCQGRGSAANSVVCYCLGITAVSPERCGLLFERFISAARNEPPDIDVDFEHERREEVIQYIYEKYGRDRAGLAATVIRYRARGAIRDVGKALGLGQDTLDRLSGTVWGWGSEGIDPDRLKEHGLDPADPVLAQSLDLSGELIGFPRHLSQHVGGFVITRGLLSELCPVVNAAMKDRTTIEWDKDDIDALGILKVDVLALGMLSCLRRGFDLLERHHGIRHDLASLPEDDPAVYGMLCRADSLGVFQVESRAQMSMLPRLKPRNFYDLVVEVAIVRPGPIQGDMVHPYLRRRQGLEKVEYPSEALREVLEKTYGVPLFQEQAMKIAMVAGGFSATEADALRRAMASFRRTGTVHAFREKLVEGMVANGYDRGFAERCFRQIEGFADYGFPESHAASFALLVYVSAWLKCRHPDVFACALLNSQPMGFYAPAQIVRDAREHRVTARPPDINRSDWDCTLEETTGPGPEGHPVRALRLGLRMVGGLRKGEAEALAGERARGGAFADPADLWRRARLDRGTLERLAEADAFRSLGLDRRAALWAVEALGEPPPPLFARLEDVGRGSEPAVELPGMPLGEHVAEDYASLGLSLKCHPVKLLRDGLSAARIRPASALRAARDGERLTVAGLVLVRQRPGSARGVVFLTLEDETGIANIVVFPSLFERFRREIMTARLLAATGRVEREGREGDEPVIHLKAERLTDLSARLSELTSGREAARRVFPDGRNFR